MPDAPQAIRPWYDRLLERLAPASDFGEETERTSRARLVLTFSAVLAAASLALAGFQLLFGSPRIAAIAASGPLVSVLAVFVLRALRSERLAAHVLCAALAVVLTAVVIVRGGIGTPIVMAYAAVPMLALVLSDRRSGLLWLGATELTLAGVWLYGRLAGPFEREQLAAPAELNVLGHGVYVAVMFVLAGVYEHLRSRALEELKAAQATLLEAERARLESEAEAKALRATRMAELGTLAAGVAHEINNPLTYVSANAAYLLGLDRPALDGEVMEVLREIAEGTARIAKIVRDVGLFSRVEPDAEPAPVDVRQVLERSLRLLGPQVNHRADVMTRYGEVPAVLGSAGRLEQVFVNVLQNALQSVPEERRGHLSVRTSMAGADRVLVEIEDDGCGMAPEVQGRALEPFFTTKPVGVGTGLGLSICYGILTGLGGAIAFDSEPGRGTRVRIELPAAGAEARASASKAAVRDASPALRLLVVDDDALVARGIERLLGGHEVSTATSAAHARELIERRGPFDAVLCDLMMPGESGMELFETVARSSPEQARRFVFMTGGAFTERAQAFLGAVSNPALEKPLAKEALEAALRAVGGA